MPPIQPAPTGLDVHMKTLFSMHVAHDTYRK